ncbi:class I SAM-dependent methyltransferase [Modestobacter sp. VKM Ac-2977]|uniref:class I SAM-dependent methyltransferase n=1 Tax=Modestobacter sp. VKM Ac-2977 TaxID=3004131 RepID=UPI0022AA4578|nr:class I SAM-dependent methyltransferase [Modestobacter sp. VKM Ac-2977]MCZ2822331.1 class I SAM-dependent methyltransferase [Modestobacter sp. VKM Ac-2977]
MIDEATLKELLLALARGSHDDVERAITNSEALDDDDRSLIRTALDTADSSAGMARALGDAIRGAGEIDFLANECYRAAFYLGDGLPDLRGNTLFEFFSTRRTGRVLDKWVHYFPVYTEHFERFRGRDVRILEIGVYRGGSLDMWRWYFGPQATIVGVDIDERAREVSAPDHVVEIGDQTDPEFLRSLSEKYGPFDIVIDDGGHEMQQQIITAETMFPLLADGGVLLTEDCHTSYWDAYQGGTGRPGTFIEWCKAKVDDINGYHRAGPVDRVWTDMVAGLSFYDSIVVLRKERRFAPFAEQVGHAEFLLLPRFTAQHLTELVAGRDAAVAQRDALSRQQAQERQEVAAERAQLQAELAAVQDELATLRAAAEQADATDTAQVVRDLTRAAATRITGLRRGPQD